MSSEKLYAYGVTDDPPTAFETDCVDGSTEVYTVEYRTLSALVSDVGTLDPAESEENVRAHDEVLREAMTRGDGRTVVPMRFGMVFEARRALKNVLRNARPAFVGTLREVEGGVEMGVKVVAPEGGTTDGRSIQDAVDATLDTIARRSNRGDRFSDRLVVNRSFLVDRGDREAFDEAVEELRDRFDDMSIQYSGPWAPYSFVTLEIGVAQ